MAAELGELQIKVSVDSSDAKSNLKDLNDEAGKSGGFFQDAAGRVLGFIGAFAGWEALKTGLEFVTDQVKDYVNVAAQSQQITAQMDQALKTTGGTSGQTASSLEALAEKLSLTTTFSKDTTLQAETLALRFTNIGSNVFPQMIEASQDLSARMGVDLNGAIRVVGRALDDPAKGFSALTRYGITFSTAVQQNIKDLVKHGETAQAQQIILEQLGVKFGGAADAAGNTFAGKLTILQNSFEELKISIGSAIIPILSQLLTLFQPLINDVGTDLVTALDGVNGYITQFADLLGKANGPLSQMNGVLGGVGDVFRTVFQSIGKDAIPFITTLVQGFQSLAPMFNGLIGQALALLPVFEGIARQGSSFGLLFTDVLTPAVHGLIIPLTELVDGVLVSLITAFGRLAPVIVSIDNEIYGVLLPIFGAIITAVGPVITVLGSVFSEIIDQLSVVLLSVGKEVQSTVIPALHQMEPTILPIIDMIGKWATQIGNVLIPIIDILGKILSTVLPIAINIVIKSFQLTIDIIGFIWPTLSAIVSGVLNTITAIVQTFSDLFAGNWGALWGDVVNVFTTLFGSIINILVTLIGSILGLLGDLFSKIGSIAKDGLDAYVNLWLSVNGRVLNAVGGLLGALGSWLGGVFSGLGTIVSTGIDATVTNFATLVGRVVGAVNGLAGQLDGVALGWMQHLANGILNGISVVLQSIAQLESGVLNALHGLVNNAKTALNNIPALGGALSFAGFADGTLNAPGGPVIVGEGEEPELVVGPHLANVAKGSGIFPLSQVSAPSGNGGYGQQLIVLQLDGQTITSVVVQNMPREIWLNTGLRGHA